MSRSNIRLGKLRRQAGQVVFAGAVERFVSRIELETIDGIRFRSRLCKLFSSKADRAVARAGVSGLAHGEDAGDRVFLGGPELPSTAGCVCGRMPGTELPPNYSRIIEGHWTPCSCVAEIV